MTAATALWPLQEGFDAVLVADGALQAALGGTVGDPKLYAGTVPEGFDALPYIVYGPASETTRGMVSQAAGAFHAEAATFDVYGRDKREAHLLYGHLKRVLHGVPVAVAGHHPVRGSVRATGIDVPEPDGRAHHTQARWEGFAQAVAS